MANLPALKTESSMTEAGLESLMEQMRRGETPHSIAMKLHPKDRIARQRMRRKLWKLIESDAQMNAALAGRGRAIGMVHLLPAMEALGKRAARGRPDAIKLLLEVTGVHNPKVKHEHSGDVAIKVTFDRPPPVEGTATQITDAEVVED